MPGLGQFQGHNDPWGAGLPGHDRLDVPPWQVYIRPDLAREFTLRSFDALRGPGRHLERLLDAALACEAAGLDPVQVLDRAMDAAALAEVELLAQADGLL